MTTSSAIKVIHADIMDGGVLIGFSDGSTVLYSASLLLTFLKQAKLVQGKDPEES